MRTAADLRLEKIQDEIKVLERDIKGYRQEIDALEFEIGETKSSRGRAEDELEKWQAKLQELQEDPEFVAQAEALAEWRKAVSNPAQMKLPLAEVKS